MIKSLILLIVFFVLFIFVSSIVQIQIQSNLYGKENFTNINSINGSSINSNSSNILNTIIDILPEEFKPMVSSISTKIMNTRIEQCQTKIHECFDDQSCKDEIKSLTMSKILDSSQINNTKFKHLIDCINDKNNS